jgi:hypothetical protein
MLAAIVAAILAVTAPGQGDAKIISAALEARYRHARTLRADFF